ncbi:hypothetical protein D9757_000649 [Collybiopsis confluens]|uniref:Transmembrane protein n=1 Tax=Collybiopsis confluens TaxID=2823264 RepID=A0A8H5MGQ1_9AGAR|nr:hypothetical protein D9757_000649 [Collybiopsis confluens]
MSSATINVPAPVLVHDSTPNAFDAFFGYTLSQTSTHDSQHDRSLNESSDSLPPAYVEPPAYEARQIEPATLAMFLFKFGFLFPLFWVMGALILVSPLRDPSDPSSDPSLPASWLPEKTAAEKKQIISKMRAVEIKWAWRCLAALAVLVLVATATGLTIWGILRVTREF